MTTDDEENLKLSNKCWICDNYMLNYMLNERTK